MDAISSSVLVLVPIESSEKSLGRKKKTLKDMFVRDVVVSKVYFYWFFLIFFFHLQAVEVPSCLVYLESQIHVVLKRGLDVGKKLLKMTTIHRQLLGKFFFLSKGSSHLLVNNLGHVSYFFMERGMLNTMYVKRNMYREHFVK